MHIPVKKISIKSFIQINYDKKLLLDAYSLVLTLILFYWESTELEKVIGSGTYFIHLFFKTIIINTITWIYVVPIVLIFDIKGAHRDFGFFPVILSDILVKLFKKIIENVFILNL